MDTVNQELLTRLASVEKRYRERSDQRVDRQLSLDLTGLSDGSLRTAISSFDQLGGAAGVIAAGGVLNLRRNAPTLARLGLESLIGENDLMDFSFVEKAGRAGRSVGRVRVRRTGGTTLGYGTGFLVSSRLMLTNNHVLRTERRAQASLLELDHAHDEAGRLRPPVAFRIRPGEFFVTDHHLDFTLVAVEPVSNDGRQLAEWGAIALSATGEAARMDRVNIIQHPGGRPKQVALRANQIVDLPEPFVHYETDTQPGSSGAPVFNDHWQLVALHHAGVPRRDEARNPLTRDGRVWGPHMRDDEIDWIANEGVLRDAIIEYLEGRSLSPAWRELFRNALRTTEQRQVVPSHRRGRQTVEPAGFEPRVQPDGSVRYTIPLHITLQLGGSDVVATSSAPAGAAPDDPPDSDHRPPDSGRTEPPEDRGGPDTPRELTRAVEALRRRYDGDQSVVQIRPGWVFEDGWITDERAIVISTRKKLPPAEIRSRGIERFPPQFAGWRVEVVQASPRHLLELDHADEMAATGLEPDFAEAKPEIAYEPPEGGGLEAVEAPMQVTCHVSPESGWTILREWLSGTQRRLTVGMYDFTAPHIADHLTRVLSAGEGRTLTLCIQKGQSGGGKPKRPERQILDDLRSALGERFDQGFADVGRRGALWASSYHIKVAVRDGQSFWLSSGNWQTSGQPLADPIGDNQTTWSGLNRRNREWHVLVEHEALAAELERYLRHDLASSRKAREAAGLELTPFEYPDLFVPDGWDEDELALEAAPKWFPPRVFASDSASKVRVQPLLTPDNYWEHVERMIRSAKHRIWIQNQTFKPKPRPYNERGFYRLLDAVHDKQRAGLDVRIVFRKIGSKADMRRKLELIRDFGFDTAHVRVQSGCHTKGIIVDSKRVLIGSHNWSEHGVLFNRDASLIFDHEGIAKWFEEVFLWDWENRSKRSIGTAPLHERIAGPGEPTPAGFVRVPWSEYFGS